jgi:hypothetical protein
MLPFAAFALAGCTSGSDGAVAVPTVAATSGLQDSPRAVLRTEDFAISFKVSGESENSADVGLQINPQMQLVRASGLGKSSRVAKGADLGNLEVVPATRQALEGGASGSGMDRSELAQLTALERPVPAPVAGTLKVTARRSSIAVPGLDVTAPLTPLQVLRFDAVPFTGVASIDSVVGQRTVACAAVWIEALGDGSSGSGSSSSAADGSPAAATVHCRLPAFVETAPGIRGDLTLTSRIVKDATVVPDIYLDYDAKSDGYAVTVASGGTRRTYPVETGPTDGVLRVVTTKAPLGAQLVMP